MTRSLSASLLIACVLGPLAGCDTAPAAKSAPAATLSGAIPEADLATVTLSPQAVSRLGIETSALDSSNVAPSLSVGGEVVVPPGRALVITAPVAGVVYAPTNGALPIGGARVTAGQPLMQLVSLPADPARIQQDVSVARARLTQATQEAERVADLFKDGLISARDQQRAQADLAAAKAAFDLASAQQSAARGDTRGASGALSSAINALVVTAPQSGIIRSISVGEGQSVAAGAPLTEVVRLDRLWVRVPVYATDAARVDRRTYATVQALGSDRDALTTRAMPIAAPPSADPMASTVDVFYELQDGAFRPGERVSVSLPLGSREELALVAPLAAIVRDMHGGAWVYEQMDSVTFARRRVDVLRVIGDRAVLGRGPVVGTRVVTAGAAELFGTEFGTGK